MQLARYGNALYIQGAGWRTDYWLDYWDRRKSGWFQPYCIVAGPGSAQVVMGPEVEINVSGAPALASLLRLDAESACNLDPSRCSGGNPNATEWVWECGWADHKPWILPSEIQQLAPTVSTDPPVIERLYHGFRSFNTNEGNDADTKFYFNAYFVAPEWLGGPYFNESSEVFWGNDSYDEHDGERVQIYVDEPPDGGELLSDAVGRTSSGAPLGAESFGKPAGDFTWYACLGNVEPCANGQPPKKRCWKSPDWGLIRIERVEQDIKYHCTACDVTLWAEDNCRPLRWVILSDAHGLVKSTSAPNSNPFVIGLDEEKLRTVPYTGNPYSTIIVKVYDAQFQNYWDAEVIKVWRPPVGVGGMDCVIEILGRGVYTVEGTTPSECEFLQTHRFCAAKNWDIRAERQRESARYFHEYCNDPGARNAFEHAWISCMTVRRCGLQEAAEQWTAHEEHSANACEQASMDLHNNAVGRANVPPCVIPGGPCQSCAEKVFEDLDAGRLRWSNEHVEYYRNGLPVPSLEDCPTWSGQLGENDPCEPYARP